MNLKWKVLIVKLLQSDQCEVTSQWDDVVTAQCEHRIGFSMNQSGSDVVSHQYRRNLKAQPCLPDRNKNKYAFQ